MCGTKLDNHEYRSLPVYSGLSLNGCQTSARQNCTCEAEWFGSAEGSVRKDLEQDVQTCGIKINIGTYLFILG
jgi:hypothetical protein